MGLAGVAFDLKSRTVRRHARAFHQQLMTEQHLPPEALARLNHERAVSIAQFAVASTAFYGPYYRDHGVDLASLDEPDAWSSLPVLERSIVKEHSDRFLSSEATDSTTRDALTGGSTGEPLRTRHDARVPSLAFSWRMYSWWGIEPWDDLARIGRWSFGRLSSLKNRIEWWPTTQVYVDAGLLDEASMKQFHSELVRTRPRLLEGYVGSLVEFADFLERTGRTVPPPAAVATTAAPLTGSIRARLEEVFRAPVHDEYRGSEVGWMAGECAQRDGLHVFADWRRIEVVGPNGRVLPDGEVGDLVITDLSNRAFPLIRYRLGDRGAMLERRCPCGVNLPLMAPVDGRTTDLLRLPSGATLGHRLMGMFSATPDAVRLFQIHQQADYSIVVRVVPGDVPDAREQIDAAVEVLRQRISYEVPIRIELVSSLPYTRGKIKYVISDV
jgi:phenylacetate-CoA ligase